MEHQKIIRTPGNLARWEAKHGVVIEQTCGYEKDAGVWIIFTRASMTVLANNDWQTVTLGVVESTTETSFDPQPALFGNRALALRNLAAKYNLWVEEMERDRRREEVKDELRQRHADLTL